MDSIPIVVLRARMHGQLPGQPLLIGCEMNLEFGILLVEILSAAWALHFASFSSTMARILPHFGQYTILTSLPYSVPSLPLNEIAQGSHIDQPKISIISTPQTGHFISTFLSSTNQRVLSGIPNISRLQCYLFGRIRTRYMKEKEFHYWTNFENQP